MIIWIYLSTFDTIHGNEMFTFVRFSSTYLRCTEKKKCFMNLHDNYAQSDNIHGKSILHPTSIMCTHCAHPVKIWPAKSWRSLQLISFTNLNCLYFTHCTKKTGISILPHKACRLANLIICLLQVLAEIKAYEP